MWNHQRDGGGQSKQVMVDGQEDVKLHVVRHTAKAKKKKCRHFKKNWDFAEHFLKEKRRRRSVNKVPSGTGNCGKEPSLTTVLEKLN